MWLWSCWSCFLFTEVSSPQRLWAWVCRHGLSWIKKIWKGELPSAEEFGLRRGLRCIWLSSICPDGGAWEWWCSQKDKRVSIAAGQETRQLSFGRHFIFCIMKPTHTSSRASLHSVFSQWRQKSNQQWCEHSCLHARIWQNINSTQTKTEKPCSISMEMYVFGVLLYNYINMYIGYFRG